MQQRLPVVLSITALVVAILGWTPVGEAAKNMVTGKQIKNRSITGVDVKKRTLTGQHVKDGTLRAKDFRPGELVEGAPGAQGETGPPGASGYEIVEFKSPTNSLNAKQHSVACPETKKAIGGGAFVDGNFVGVALARSFPERDGSGWRAYALEINPNANDWHLNVFAICATVETEVVP